MGGHQHKKQAIIPFSLTKPKQKQPAIAQRIQEKCLQASIKVMLRYFLISSLI